MKNSNSTLESITTKNATTHPHPTSNVVNHDIILNNNSTKQHEIDFHDKIDKNKYRDASKSDMDILMKDSYLSNYIKSKDKNSIVRHHHTAFQSKELERKSKSFEIYQKYLRLSPNGQIHGKEPQNRQPLTNIIPSISDSKDKKAVSLIDVKSHDEKLNNNRHSLSKNIKQDTEKSPIRNISKPSIRPHDDLIRHSIIKKRLPIDFMDCSIESLIILISRMLQSLIALNDKSVPLSISQPSSSSFRDPVEISTKSSNEGDSQLDSSNSSNNLLTRYHSRVPPSISTFTYLTRLTKFNNFNTATLLTTIYYIDLLSHQYQPFFTLNSWTVHRFLLVATMIAQKSLEDFFYTNDHYAKVGGVAISELNCLELDFLNRIDWRCIPGRQKTRDEILEQRTSYSIEKDILRTRFCQIRFGRDVLNMYYFQLIELMGRATPNDDVESKNLHFVKETDEKPSGSEIDNYGCNSDDEDYDEDYNDEEDIAEWYEEEKTVKSFIGDRASDDPCNRDLVSNNTFEKEKIMIDNNYTNDDFETDDNDNDDKVANGSKNFKKGKGDYDARVKKMDYSSGPKYANNYQYDHRGRNVDGSSSPHLKRRHSNVEEFHGKVLIGNIIRRSSNNGSNP